MRRYRDWSLYAKLTLTLTLALSAAAGLFLVALLSLQRGQRQRLLEQEQRLVATLIDVRQRSLIYDIVGRSRESLDADLADLARQPGILWARLEAEGVDLQATADAASILRLLGPGAELPREGASAPVLLLDGQRGMRLVGSAGQTLLAAGPAPETSIWPGAPAAGRFQEIEWGGQPVLRASVELSAADVRYGRLSLLHSLQAIRAAEARTRTIFYGMVATTFALLLVLLDRLLSRLVIAPLRRLAQAMSETSRGHAEVRLPEHSGDEIGSMAVSFNRMAQEIEGSSREIEAYSRHLEEMVEERTRALRASEQRLTAARNHLATVIAHVATGVVSLDADGRVTTFNRRAAEILGVAADQALGRPLEELCGTGEARRLAEFAAQARGGAPRQAQFALRLPQRLRTLAVVASPLLAEGEPRPGMVLVFDDLTEILATQRLTAWKEAVERVIHEIKNPLTPVGLAAQALKTAFENDRPKFDAMFPQAVVLILRSVEDLRELIAEFSRFSRLPRLAPRRLELGALVREVLAPYQQGALPGVRVRHLPADGSLLFDGDPDQLKRVLLNVVLNGVEAMEQKGGELLVATSAPPGSNRVAVSVRDQGPGIEDVERIFEPHYTTKAKGTGLGLAIARQIVAEHGGEIRVESTPGTGTAVTILLPAAPPAQVGEPDSR